MEKTTVERKKVTGMEKTIVENDPQGPDARQPSGNASFEIAIKTDK